MQSGAHLFSSGKAFARMISDKALGFLQRLLETPSPSGFEEPNAAHFRDYVAPFADEVTTDALGNVIACVNPGGSPRVLPAGHAGAHRVPAGPTLHEGVWFFAN